MKKIMFYIGSMQYGGANRVVANLIDYFIKNNYDIILLNDIFPKKYKKEYIISKDVRRYFIENKIKSRVLKNLSMIMHIRKIIKKEQPDVLISFMGPPNIRTIVSTFGLRIKKIVSVRNDPYIEYGSGIKRIISRIILNHADGCVFQTTEAKKYFKKQLQKKSRIIFNPVNEKFYEIRRDSNTKNIITIGRLEKQKNHKLLIDSYINIHNKIKNDKLLIYGDGSLKKELEEYIKEKGMEKDILLLGTISDVWEKLAKAKLFVLSSNYEGMPNALMEAMAVGVPVISTDCPCGGPKDLILTQSQGRLVKCNNETELSNSIVYLINNKDLLDKMSVVTRERAEQFKSDLILKQWENYINQIIET